jgi:methylmalonyl-CoA mutase C-terminal domain/subunit
MLMVLHPDRGRGPLAALQFDSELQFPTNFAYRIQYSVFAASSQAAAAGRRTATAATAPPIAHGPTPMSSPPIRVLLAKVGLDGHDRGVKVVARTLRDAGMDVVYSGLHRTPEEVVNTAIQEDVDVLGVSLLSGVQLTVFPKLFRLLSERGADDIIVVAGGVMPAEDVAAIKQMGVREVLLQDTPPQAIVDTLTRLVAERGPR